jgi:hypothetical protein
MTNKAIEYLREAIKNDWPWTVSVTTEDAKSIIEKIEELESCLRWYVEEDDTNMTQPSNEFWIEGKHRAMRALGMEVE